MVSCALAPQWPRLAQAMRPHTRRSLVSGRPGWHSCTANGTKRWIGSTSASRSLASADSTKPASEGSIMDEAVLEGSGNALEQEPERDGRGDDIAGPSLDAAKRDDRARRVPPGKRPTPGAQNHKSHSASNELPVVPPGVYRPDIPLSRDAARQGKFMLSTYARPPMVVDRGEGCYLYDTHNRKYLDFTAGIAVTSLGHGDPTLRNILGRQASRLWHASNLYYTHAVGAFSKKLVETTRSCRGMYDAYSAFVCNSGTEANEAALKLARKVGKTLKPEGDKHEIICFNGAFHGRTMGALSATPQAKYQDPFKPLIPGVKVGTFNNISLIKHLVTPWTCGVIVEPVQGEGGIQVADPAFLSVLARRCREVGAVLIYDEIQCGIGRTGKLWAHCELPREAHPDIVTTAKALANGFPMGAVIVNKRVHDMIKIGDHGTTFGGNPIGSELASEVLRRVTEPAFLERIPTLSQRFEDHFARLKTRFPQLVDSWRGQGLMLGLQLKRDPAPIVAAARERGLLVITAGHNTLRFVPPLIITPAQIDEGMKILATAMAEVVEVGEARIHGEQVHGEVDSPN